MSVFGAVGGRSAANQRKCRPLVPAPAFRYKPVGAACRLKALPTMGTITGATRRPGHGGGRGCWRNVAAGGDVGAAEEVERRGLKP